MADRLGDAVVSGEEHVQPFLTLLKPTDRKCFISSGLDVQNFSPRGCEAFAELEINVLRIEGTQMLD